MTRIPTGTTFTLYGVARHPLTGCLMLRADVRVKDAQASHSVSGEWLAESWPNTNAGMRAAMERTGEMNRQTAEAFKAVAS